MNTLKNHLILYDAECPMCRAYTSAFVKTGLLDANGRAAYQETAEASCPMVDRQRAVNEIALINQTTGEVSYGIRSLFKLFAAAVPVLKLVFEFKPLIVAMSKVYAFISYNRRVIIPAGSGQYAYQPTFKLNYRIAYLLFTWAVTAYVLTAYIHLMYGLLPVGAGYREYLVCAGQLLFQALIVGIIAKDKTWAYLGNMMTVCFAGALLLLPALIIARYFNLPPLFYVIYLMLTAVLMLLEHIRRTKLLKLGWALSISWIGYSLMALTLFF